MILSICFCIFVVGKSKIIKKSLENKIKSISKREWLFVALILILIVYSVMSYIKFGQIKDFLTEEKENLEIELSELASQYEKAVFEKNSLKTELIEKKERISRLVDSVKKIDITMALLREYKEQIRVLQEEKKELFYLADSLDMANQILKVQRDEARSTLKSQVSLNSKLTVTNNKLQETIENSSLLDIANLESSSLAIDDGIYEETLASGSTHKIKTCFTLLKNKLAKKGDKKVYVVAINPQDSIVAKRKANYFIDPDGLKRYYSAHKEVYYENEDLDVCVYISGSKREYVSGIYLIGVFIDGLFKSEQELLLK